MVTETRIDHPWCHPETGLEYASQAAFEEGRDPIPHWRNARIKDINRFYGQGSPRAKARCQELCTHFTRQGREETSVEHYSCWWLPA